jgi:hypothetical protein
MNFQLTCALRLFQIVVCFQLNNSNAAAATTNLFPAADTALRSNAPDNSLGASASLPVGVGGSGAPINHGLFKFPLGQIPATATVTEATLQLSSIVSNPNTQLTANYQLFRLLQDWNETDTTWNTRIAPFIGWGGAGGQTGVDYVSTASGAALIAPATPSGPSVSLFSDPGILNDVNLWRANPGTNFGWILIAENELAASGKQIASREDASNTPVLIITYTLPAAPPTIFAAAQINQQIRFSFHAAADQAYAVETNDSLTNSNWTQLLVLPASPADTVVHLTNNFTGNQKFFRLKLEDNVALN